MTKVHFHACYLPNHGEFNVTVRFGKKRIFEKMTIAKFLRFARQTHKPIIVDGITVSFDELGNEVETAVRSYFKQVADAYVQTRYKNN